MRKKQTNKQNFFKKKMHKAKSSFSLYRLHYAEAYVEVADATSAMLRKAAHVECHTIDNLVDKKLRRNTNKQI